jgi:hypothetical protein
MKNQNVKCWCQLWRGKGYGEGKKASEKLTNKGTMVADVGTSSGMSKGSKRRPR